MDQNTYQATIKLKNNTDWPVNQHNWIIATKELPDLNKIDKVILDPGEVQKVKAYVHTSRTIYLINLQGEIVDYKTN